jgi:hypothetical protein
MKIQYGAKVLNPVFAVKLEEDRFTLWDLLGLVGALLQSFVLALIFATSYVFLTQPVEAMRFLMAYL